MVEGSILKISKKVLVQTSETHTDNINICWRTVTGTYCKLRLLFTSWNHQLAIQVLKWTLCFKNQ